MTGVTSKQMMQQSRFEPGTVTATKAISWPLASDVSAFRDSLSERVEPQKFDFIHINFTVETANCRELVSRRVRVSQSTGTIGSVSAALTLSNDMLAYEGMESSRKFFLSLSILGMANIRWIANRIIHLVTLSSCLSAKGLAKGFPVNGYVI